MNAPTPSMLARMPIPSGAEMQPVLRDHRHHLVNGQANTL